VGHRESTALHVAAELREEHSQQAVPGLRRHDGQSGSGRSLLNKRDNKSAENDFFHLYILLAAPQVPISFDSNAINRMVRVQDGDSPLDDPVNGYIHLASETSLVVHLKGEIHIDQNWSYKIYLIRRVYQLTIHCFERSNHF
jgi:hypothetical protein